MTAVTMRELFEAGAHYGHRNTYRNPKMDRYIYTTRNRVNIINLEKSLPLLNKACAFAKKVANRNGRIMFVGTKRSAGTIIKEQALRAGMPYIDYRWLGGMLTNYKTVKQSVQRFMDIDKMKAEGTFAALTKKEALMKQRELEKLERSLGGIKDMRNLPDALFVLDVGHENIAVKEANKLGIPVIGVVDTNSSPDGIDFVIPGNDDATKAIELYVKSIADSILAGRGAAKGEVSESDFVETVDED